MVIPYYHPQGVDCNSEKCLKDNAISMKLLLEKINKDAELNLEETPYFSIVELKTH